MSVFSLTTDKMDKLDKIFFHIISEHHIILITLFSWNIDIEN